jgi:hypothetical protein
MSADCHHGHEILMLMMMMVAIDCYTQGQTPAQRYHYHEYYCCYYYTIEDDSTLLTNGRQWDRAKRSPPSFIRCGPLSASSGFFNFFLILMRCGPLSASSGVRVRACVFVRVRTYH